MEKDISVDIDQEPSLRQKCTYNIFEKYVVKKGIEKLKIFLKPIKFIVSTNVNESSNEKLARKEAQQRYCPRKDY